MGYRGLTPRTDVCSERDGCLFWPRVYEAWPTRGWVWIVHSARSGIDRAVDRMPMRLIVRLARSFGLM